MPSFTHQKIHKILVLNRICCHSGQHFLLQVLFSETALDLAGAEKTIQSLAKPLIVLHLRSEKMAGASRFVSNCFQF